MTAPAPASATRRIAAFLLLSADGSAEIAPAVLDDIEAEEFARRLRAWLLGEVVDALLDGLGEGEGGGR